MTSHSHRIGLVFFFAVSLVFTQPGLSKEAKNKPLEMIPQQLGGHPEAMMQEGFRDVLDITKDWAVDRPKDRPEEPVYTQTVDLSESWTGKAVFLFIDDAWPGAELTVNGKPAGKYLHCNHAYGCVDITPYVHPGKNTLQVRFLPEKILEYPKKNGEIHLIAPTTAPKPEGAIFYDKKDKGRYVGFYGRVFLIGVAPAHITWVKIEPDTSSRTVRLKGTIVGAKGHNLQLRAGLHEIGIQKKPELVFGCKDKPEVSLAEKSISPKGDAETFEMVVPFPKEAKLWRPDKPFLYGVRVTLSEAGKDKPIDVFLGRTGLRCTGIRGDQFTLNGNLFLPRMFFSNRTTKLSNWEIDKIVYEVSSGKQRNWNYTLWRNHISPVARIYYPFADQYGLLTISQCCDPGPPFDDFTHPHWKNWRIDVDRMVQQNGNSPSVYMWSAENENISQQRYVDRDGSVTKEFVKILDHFHKVDPTRNVTFEGDGDLRGACETWNEHYPWRYGEFLWPVDGYWLDKPHLANNADYRARGTVNLAKLGKPILFGETIWFPSGGAVRDTAFVGDLSYEYFINYPQHGWRTPDGLSKFAMIARSLNIQKVAAFAMPGSGSEGAYIAQRWNNPDAVFQKEEHRQYFGGDKIKRTFVVCNAGFDDATYELQAAVVADGKTLAETQRTIPVATGDRKVDALELPLPVVHRLRPAQLRLVLRKDGRITDVSSQHFKIYPKQFDFTPSPGRVVLLDPSGKTAAALKQLNVSAKRIPAVTATSLKDADLLILGDGALDAKAKVDPQTVKAYLQCGGNILVLAQKKIKTIDWIPSDMKLDADKRATMAHIVTPHPLLKIRGIEGDDLKWWLGDHFVARACYRKPVQGNFRVLADVGSWGLPHAVLLEEFHEKGIVIFNQLACVEKFDTAPVARELLAACVEYGLTASREMGKLAVLAPAPMKEPLLDRLKRVNADFDIIDAGDLTPRGLAKYVAVLIPPNEKARLATIARGEVLRRWVFRDGGTVVFHRVEPEGIDAVHTLTDPWGFEIRKAPDAKRPIYKLRREMDDDLATGLSNEWLWWIPGNVYRPNELKGQTEHMYDQRVYVDPRWEFNNDDFACLTSMDALARLRYGQGRIVFDQLRWSVNTQLLGKQLAYLRWLMTAIGVRMGNQAFRQVDLTGAKFFPVDLRSAVNRPLKDDGDPKSSWFGFGANSDMRNLPVGRHTWAGVPFEVIDSSKNDNRSCIILHGHAGEQFPRRSKPIPVNRACRYLAFHQAAAYADPGQVIATYLVQYEDGKTLKIPVIVGQHVSDWWHEADTLSGAVPAWLGRVTDGHLVVTYCSIWANPRPKEKIKSITVHAGDPALTAADQIIEHGMPAVISITSIE
ncbi:MAG: hypothetical protein JXA11_04505 [Phycisphaerae bacterium]|nr:hypothetical protein [Phycisphaerae bacterium]